jgi:23S rRNA (guanosine2251-2'-O)-methyltransferase
MRKLKNNELNRKSIGEFKKTKKIPVSIILDNVRSQHNIGSVFRTADAFLIEKIYLCGISSTPPNKEIHKTALGATDSVDWEYHENTQTVVEMLKKSGHQVIGIEQAEGNVSLNEFEPPKIQPVALVFGHEVKGVQQGIVDLCDVVIELPQYGTKHSLNISVCAGIVIWDFFNKLNN